MLTAERLRTLVNFDPETGVFSYAQWRRGLRRDAVGKPAGWFTDEGYVSLQIDGRNYQAHRLAWLHFYGREPAHEIDHINGVRNDNRISNLRDVPRQINAQNQRASMPKTLADAPLGVSWHRAAEKWRAMIWDGKKNIYLGLFEDAQLAHLAYVEAKRRLHPGCTL